MAKLAQACGLDSVTDLDDCVGKFVKATFKGNDYEGKTYLNLVSAEKYGIAKPIAPLKQEPKPEPAVQTAPEEEAKNDLMF